MLGHATYFFILLAPGLLMNGLLWAIWRKLLKPQIKAIAASIGMISLYWGAIDFIAIRLLGIWTFQSQHTSGIMAGGLLLEEWTLFIVSGSIIVPLIFLFAQAYKQKTA